MSSVKSQSYGSEGNDMILNLGSYTAAVEKRLSSWEDEDFAQRFWDKDFTLWSLKPIPELTDRMGWLEIFEPMHDHLKNMIELADEIKTSGFKHVVLMGMGGSSLAPEVFQNVFGNTEGFPELLILDTTHPTAIRRIEERIDISKTIFVVSSKSGSTIETLSAFNYFWKKVGGPTPGVHFIAITDPESSLMKLAAEKGFRKSFPGTPDVGGRYSALTLFGLVPAYLIGTDGHKLLDRGWDIAGASAGYLSVEDNPCLKLGAILGELALAGRDKITFFTTPSLRAFPTWIEQLIAESTGKEGKGIVPIVDEIIEDPWVYRKDRVFVHYILNSENSAEINAKVKALEEAGHPVIRLILNTKDDLGMELFRWEMAVAAAGSILGINPFDQPDVQLAKELAKQAMEQKAPKPAAKNEKSDVETIMLDQTIIAAKAFESFIGGARLNDYIAVQAYLAPDYDTEAALQEFRLSLRDRLKLATTFGWGPRFLHSTGQLHKGGPNNGVFIQIVDEPQDDIHVPETNYTFGSLIQAQALGDYKALKQRGRRVIRLNLGPDAGKGLELLFKLLD